MLRAVVRTIALPVLVVLALVLAVGFGVSASLQQMERATLLREGALRAGDLAEELVAQIPDTPQIIANGRATDDQARLLSAVMTGSAVFQVRLYAPDGTLRYATDRESAAGLAPEAAAVYNTLQPNLQLLRQGPAGDRVTVTALVPLASPGDGVFGVIETAADASHLAGLLTAMFQRLSLALIVLTTVAVLLPALILIWRNDQVRRRDHALVQLAKFDPLTGILNRGALTREGQDAVKQRDGDGPDATLGFLFFDIDRFRTVNDELGHDFGDRLLHHVARIARASVRDSDLLGRIGGDEFVLILRAIDLEMLEQVADRISNQVRSLFVYDQVTVSPSISIGCHLSPRGEKFAEALRRADAALKAAKAAGRGQISTYTAALDRPRQRRAEVEAAVRNGILQQRFTLDYQPIYDASAINVLGFEAVLRLHDTAGAPIAPEEFLPVAEATGLIGDLASWTLTTAIGAARTWPEGRFVAVNLSPHQFQAGDLVECVRTALRKSGMPPHRLELEIPEAALLEDAVKLAHQLTGLRDLGVALVLDNFGTGASGLGHLWKHSFDKVKIDSVFLEAHEFHSDKYAKILSTLVVLGQNLGLSVAVEGVKNAQQLDMLQRLACDQYQGAHLCAPMRNGEIPGLLGQPARLRSV
ncbi:MAG: bifunctional diguanylate cyclase/phosphodiesterase [Pseudomonadota bacterium]